MYQVKFDCSHLKNLRVGTKRITSFSVREIDGADEELAANYAKSKGGVSNAGEEAVRIAIVEVNGEAVKQPYLAFDTWNSRARSFCLNAFRSLNGTTDSEVEGFLSAGVGTGGDDAPPATA